jgi:hypothetical protein
MGITACINGGGAAREKVLKCTRPPTHDNR